MFAPAAANASAASCTRAPTAASTPSTSSATNPTRSPSTPSARAETVRGTGRSRQVESSGSCPPITSNSTALSVTVVVRGPIWSSELAKATSP